MKIELCDGLTLPFFPMRPAKGRTLRTPKLAREFIREFDPGFWIMQPKLNGRRACLATYADKVYIQNRQGSWFSTGVVNAKAFLKLGSGFCFDGEVWQDKFYPFDLLAEAGASLLDKPAKDRIAMAKTWTLKLGELWIFDQPKDSWLMERTAHMPQWEGVVLKKREAGYTIHADSNQTSLNWLKRRWDNRPSIET